jgi:hypothetical protein
VCDWICSAVGTINVTIGNNKPLYIIVHGIV